MTENQIYVFKRGNEWITKKAHSDRTLSKHKTRHEAIGMAVYYAKRDGNTEVIVC